ncbi:Aldo/keto reductase [Coprinopsis sp. MPI-PUGE-AT-0042]|nr:Aldo/keto reductase [Coprinopsis sp. MPI-PUGE-AT-0042]
MANALKFSSTVKLSSGYHIPRLGLGVYQNYTTKESVLEAIKVGYRHFDTAQAYKNEAHVAEGIREGGISREDVFVTTKIISKFHGYEKTRKAILESLERMQLDYIDLFLIHNPHAGKDLRLETYKALVDAQSEGIIRSVGVSNYGVHHLQEITDAGYPPPAVNQIELHPFCQQRHIVEFCFKHGIVIEAYSPLVRGDLGHRVFQELSEKCNKEPAQIVLRWSLQKGFVPLPKSANHGRIRTNTELYDFELSEEDMAMLGGLDKGKEGAITWNPVDVP